MFKVSLKFRFNYSKSHAEEVHFKNLSFFDREALEDLFLDPIILSMTTYKNEETGRYDVQIEYDSRKETTLKKLLLQVGLK